jgi:transcriptional regulator with PAS, ATPase and Fis domain
LVGHFIKKFSKKVGKPVQTITPDALKTLQNYSFPGNVRELENIIERAIILSGTMTLTLKDLGILPTSPKISVKRGTLKEIQKQAILDSLRRWEGNRTRAAEELGINRRTIQNKIREYGLKDV